MTIIKSIYLCVKVWDVKHKKTNNVLESYQYGLMSNSNVFCAHRLSGGYTDAFGHRLNYDVVTMAFYWVIMKSIV